jgi:hypothetical protein
VCSLLQRAIAPDLDIHIVRVCAILITISGEQWIGTLGAPLYIIRRSSGGLFAR